MPSVKAAELSAQASSQRSWDNDMRDIILFQCTECKNRNYSSMKNKKNTPDKLQRKKYCRNCRRHTMHKEIKA